MDDKKEGPKSGPKKERKQQERKEEKFHTKSQNFNERKSSPQLDSPSTSSALPKHSIKEKKPEETQNMGDTAAKETDIKEPKMSKKLKLSPKNSLKSGKDSPTSAETRKSKVRRPGGLPHLPVERICLGNDCTDVERDVSEFLFSESLIKEITEKEKVFVVEDPEKREVFEMQPVREEKLEKCSRTLLQNLKKRAQRVIRKKYDCHKQWIKMKKEIKELKRQDEEQKVWMLRNLDSPLHEEDDLNTKRVLLDSHYHIFQTVLISIIALSMMNPQMYFFSNQTASLFFDEITISPNSNETRNSTAREQKRTFRDSRGINDFWAFAENSLINVLYSNFLNSYVDPETHTAEEDKKDKHVNQILGVARIRQVRVRNDSCLIHPDMNRFFSECYYYYTVFKESTEPIRDDMGNSVTATAWKFTEAKNLSTTYYCGQISCYGGGGYHLDFSKDKATSAKKLEELRENDWVSEATRAVFIDFTIYNANANLFCICRILVEMLPTGGILPRADFNTLKLIRYLNNVDFLILAFEILYSLLIIYITCSEICKIHRQKSYYLFNVWNYLQIVILLLSYAFIAFLIIRFFYTESVLKKLEDEYYEYVNFEYVQDIQMFFNNVTALLVFASWVKLFSFFNFTTSLLRFQRTLARSLLNMAIFIPMFVTMLAAFSILAFLLFGQRVKEYSSLSRAFLTLTQAFLGEFNCTYILETNRILGPLFYILFVFFVFFVLVNVFIAIINEAYTSVMSVAYGNTPSHGNYLLRCLMNTLSCCRPVVKKKPLNYSLRKKFLFQEIENALKRAGFRDKEIKIFFHKYKINYLNFLDEKTKSKIAADLKLKEFEVNATSEQFQIDILKKKYDNVRHLLELLDTKLQPVIDKVDIIIHRL